LRIFAVAITPDSSTAYVPDAATDTVQVIDTGSKTRHGDDHGPGHRTLRARGLAGGQ